MRFQDGIISWHFEVTIPVKFTTPPIPSQTKSMTTPETRSNWMVLICSPKLSNWTRLHSRHQLMPGMSSYSYSHAPYSIFHNFSGHMDPYNNRTYIIHQPTHYYCHDPKTVIIFHKHHEHKMHLKNSYNKKSCMLHLVHFQFKWEFNLVRTGQNWPLPVLADCPSIITTGRSVMSCDMSET
jgi:hypothetical protein